MVQILLGITTNLTCHSRTDLDLTISLAKTEPKYARGHLFSHMAQLLPRKGLKLCRTRKHERADIWKKTKKHERADIWMGHKKFSKKGL